MTCYRFASLVCSLIGLAWLCAGCRINQQSTNLEPDFYRVLYSGRPDLQRKRVYVVDKGDTLQLINPETDSRENVASETYRPWSFYSAEVDVDVFTLPFKVRPAQGSLPPQLNSNFNAALYLGKRLDFHRYRWQQVTPTMEVRQLYSRGFGYGIFAGLGSATINDVVTRNQLGFEYEGVVLNGGAAVIYDARIFNVGLALGVDHLIDKNRQLWVYQHRPWFGVLFGLNLN